MFLIPKSDPLQSEIEPEDNFFSLFFFLLVMFIVGNATGKKCSACEESPADLLR